MIEIPKLLAPRHFFSDGFYVLDIFDQYIHINTRINGFKFPTFYLVPVIKWMKHILKLKEMYNFITVSQMEIIILEKNLEYNSIKISVEFCFNFAFNCEMIKDNNREYCTFVVRQPIDLIHFLKI